MAYIGRGLQSGAFSQLDDISSGFDGSDTTHTMQVNSTNVTVGDVNQILLSLGGVIQKPGTDFTVSGSVLTFTTAPAANTSFFAVLLGSDNGGTVTPTDGSVTASKFASGVAIGATGTANTLAGIPFFSDTTNGSIYTHDVSGTDSTAQYNTAYGLTALDAVTTGDKNTCIGYDAGGALTTGSANTIIGENAGSNGAITGDDNTVVGKIAGYALTSGHSNTLIGRHAASALNTGARNTALGNGALDSAADGENENTAIGYNALAGASLAGAEYNIAIGNYSLDAITSGDNNVAIGFDAGTDVTTASNCTLLGTQAGMNIMEGNTNTCIGESAGMDLTTGYMNTFIGRHSGYEATTGNQNTAVGVYALYSSVGASYYNVAMGYAAGYAITTGDNLICIGTDSGRTGSPGGNITTQNNYIMLGDENITECNIQVDWTVASDERDKTDFTALDIGLDFVNSLKPYTYKWDKRSKYGDKLAHDYDLNAQTPDGTHKEDWLDIGFKAQEVEVLEKAAGYKIADKTNLTTSLTDDGKQYGIKYNKFVPILVKAVQELSAKVKALEDA